MKQYTELYKLKDDAKNRLRGKYGDMALGCFLFFLLPAIAFAFLIFLPVLMLLTGGPLALYQFYTGSIQTGLILCQILGGFFKLGVSYLCFRIVCGQHCYYGNIFYGFSREALLKTLLLSVLRLLVRLIFQLPFLYLVIRYADSMDYRMFLAAILVFAAGYAVYIPFGLTFDIAFYLILDFPDQKLSAILRDSLYVIHGHRRRFFLLKLGFLPLYALCIMSLGVGFLWICPYAHMSQVLFYLDLMNPKVSGS